MLSSKTALPDSMRAVFGECLSHGDQVAGVCLGRKEYAGVLESDIIGDSPTENARAYNATNGAKNSPEEEEIARLSALYDTYCATVYGMAAHFVGVGPIAEAVVEEVFVRAWRAGVDEWILSDEANDSRDHEGRPQRMEAARTWLIRLTHALAVAILRSVRHCTRCRSLQEHRAHLPPLSGLLLSELGMDGAVHRNEASAGSVEHL